MKDIQSQPDGRNIPINRVGIKNLKHPIRVLDKANKIQDTVATISMYVDLPHTDKGTHMSRFVELLSTFHTNISYKEFSRILSQMKHHLNAQTSHIEIDFPFFIAKKAPVTASVGMMDYRCKIVAKSSASNKVDLILEVFVPISSVCPCSKEISVYGAHNQRGEVHLRTRSNSLVWLEDMIHLVEKCASCEIYSVLKRKDEKYVTEHAYNNAKFVEDIARDIVLELKQRTDIIWFTVSVENFESIHNHSAYAYISSE